MLLFEPEAEYGSKNKTPNIDVKLYEALNKAYNKKLTPEEILYYIYGIFYSNVYRERFAEFLKIDFPRVPFTKDYNLFSKIAGLGNNLAELHLVKENCHLLKETISKYFSAESDKIEKLIYSESEKRIYINNGSYFSNVSHEVWNYRIGGYQVLSKYLDDRRKAAREMEDSRYFNRVISAVHHTIEIQQLLDELYPNVENDLIEL